MTPSRFAWVFNLDAEFELARPRYTTPRKLQAQLDLHGAGARALMGSGDVEVTPAVRPAARLAAPEAYVGRAWCPTPAAVATLRANGVTPEPHPTAQVLRRVNHRRFACELAAELGSGLPGGHGTQLEGRRWIESGEALLEALARPPPPGARGWLLKRPLAFAGRGQQRLPASDGSTAPGFLADKQRAWIAASLKHGEGLVLEPLVTPSLELSLHGFLQRDGTFVLGALCHQTVDERGVFRGVTRVAPGTATAQEGETTVATGGRVARALAEAGYFGPFGIDAYRHERGFCALGEINARYTLGFAVGFGGPAQLPLR